MARLTFILSLLTALGMALGWFRIILDEWRAWRMKRNGSRWLLVIVPLLWFGFSHTEQVQAAAYCNGTDETTHQANCTGGDGSVVLIDDFERGNWGATYCDDTNASNYGWNFTPFPPGTAVSCTDPLKTGGSAPGTGGHAGGFNGSNYAAASGPWDAGGGQAYLMADHTLRGATTSTNGYTHIYWRYYIKKVRPFTAGGQKHVTFNTCCAGIGGIKFANFTSGGSGGSGQLPPDGSQVQGEQLLVPFEDANRDSNIASWSWTAGDWWFVEIEIQLNTPGSANGVYRLWMDNCGTTGSSCTGSPTLRAQHTNVSYRASGDNTNIGSIWLENWTNPASVGEEYYDNIVVATSGPIGFAGSTGGGGSSGTLAFFLRHLAPFVTVTDLLIAAHLWRHRSQAVKAAVMIWRYAAYPKAWWWTYRYTRAVKRWQAEAPIMLTDQRVQILEPANERERTLWQ